MSFLTALSKTSMNTARQQVMGISWNLVMSSSADSLIIKSRVSSLSLMSSAVSVSSGR